MKRIFVYGTLRTDMYNYEKYLKDKIIQSELAYVKGSLHEIKGVIYPALIEGDDMIAGEIMEVDDDQIFDELDELEGYLGELHMDNELIVYLFICTISVMKNRKTVYPAVLWSVIMSPLCVKKVIAVYDYKPVVRDMTGFFLSAAVS